MKDKRRFLWVCILLLCSYFLAGNPGRCEASPDAHLPETTFNFRSVAEGTKISHDFVVQNKGDSLLIIEKILTG